MKNYGIGVTHKRAYKKRDFDSDALFHMTKVVSSIDDIDYMDYEAQSEFVKQYIGDYGDTDVSEEQPISLWIGSLGAYNAGYLVGLWVNLPTDEEVIDEVVDMMTFGGRGDYLIADYSVYDEHLADMIGEYSDPHQINQLAEELSGVNEWLRKPLELVMSEWGITSDLEEAKDIASEVYVYPSRNDAFYEFVENSDPTRLVFYLDRPYFEQEMGYDWYEGGELYESYGGDFDAYIEEMIDYYFMQGAMSASQLASYIDEDSFMNEIDMEATTYQDSSGYYVYYG